MVWITTVEPRKQAEKQEHITNADTVVIKVSLRSPDLAEGTTGSLEHWIVVAETRSRQPSLRYPFHDGAEPKVVVGGLGSDGIGDRDARRSAVDDRRRRTARSAVKSLSAEYDLHYRLLYQSVLRGGIDGQPLLAFAGEVARHVHQRAAHRPSSFYPRVGWKDDQWTRKLQERFHMWGKVHLDTSTLPFTATRE